MKRSTPPTRAEPRRIEWKPAERKPIWKPGEEGVRAGYLHCVRITKARARNFYYAFLTLPKSSRWAICAVYAYCRLLDDIADGPLERDAKRREIQDLRDRLHAAAEGCGDSPVFRALGDAIRRYGIPVRHLLEVADGVERDLYVNRYETFADLREYCYLVASAVGLACMEVFGYKDETARDRAVDLGIAMQLTNVLRDVAEDAANGRIYLPQADLARFGVKEDDLRRPVATERVTELLRFQAERAKSYYSRARALFDYLPRRSRPCPMVLYGVYRSLLAEIERLGYDVFSRSVALKRRRRAQIALSLYVRGLLWKAPS